MAVTCGAVGAREATVTGTSSEATVPVKILPRSGCQGAEGMAAPDVISRSQLLPNDTAQQAAGNGTADAVQSPLARDIVTSRQGPSMLTSHGRSLTVVAVEPSSPQSQQCAPVTVAAAAGTRHPQSTIPDLPIMDFVPSGKIESADFALYAQMHLHNPQFHQQQWERNDISPPHPVIESFPSFRTPCTTEDLASEAEASAETGPDNSAHQQQDQPAEAGTPTHLQASEAIISSNAQHASPQGNIDATSPSTSHSSMSSPIQQQQPALPAMRRRSVSLLSQQLATARSAAAATAATTAAEYEAGTSGRHRSEFWKYLQEQRAKEAAQMEAALQRNGHSKQQHQQQQHYALQPVILEVEEASPHFKHKQQQQQQRRQTHSQERQHLLQWQPHDVAYSAAQPQQQLPPLPRKAQVLAKPPPPQQQQQQPAPSRSPFTAVANGFVTPPGPAPPPGGASAAVAEGAATAAEAHAAKQPTSAAATGGSAASPGLLDATLASQEAAGWSHQYISGCTDATAHHQKQRHDQQPGERLPAQQQGQTASHDGSNHSGQQYRRRSSSVLDHQQSQEQPLLLHTERAADLAAVDQRQRWPTQAWIFSDDLILPGDLQQQQLQQQRDGLWAWGFDHLAPSASSVSAAGDDLVYTSLGQLPGDSVRLNQMLAAAAAGTPPAPRQGSRFDDMDSVSGSMHGASYYAGQQQQQRPGSAGFRRSSFGGSSRDGSSYRSLSQLMAAVGVGNSSSVLGQGVAASAAACVVSDHLDTLLGELSLFGERSAAEVGQELAVASSIQQIVSQHRLRTVQGYREPGGSSSSRRQSSSGAIAATHLHRSGMKQLSGWVGSTIDRTSSWLARSATAAMRSMMGSSSGSNLVYGGTSSSQPAGGGLLADRSRRSLPAGHRGPAAAGTGGGTLWQYGGSSSSVGAAGRGAGQQQQQQRGQLRQQQPLGQAARRWR